MNKVICWLRNSAENKKYFELIGSILTIPVLGTVILLNTTNLSKNLQANASEKKENVLGAVDVNQKSAEKIVTVTIVVTPTPDSKTSPVPTQTPSPTSSQVCKPEVGSVDLTSPKENETVTGDSVCFEVKQQDGNYCGVAYSYRINGGNWSDYQDKPSCLYNMTSGNKVLDVRVRSIASSDEKVLTRKFVYQVPSSTVSVTPTPTVTVAPESAASSTSTSSAEVK
jgi:hypothetical protein